MIEESAIALEIPARLRGIVEAAAQGHADKEIAQRLGLSIHTVDTHWRRLRECFGASNRAETIAKYLAWLHRQADDENTIREANLREEVERLRARIARLEAMLVEREAFSVRLVEDAVRTGWSDAHQRERLERLERAAECSETVLYEGEVGGMWRKHWATTNLNRFGYSSEEFVSGGLRVADIVPPEDLMANYAAFERTMNGRGDGLLSYYRVRQKDGELRWVRDKITFQRDDAGHATSYFGAVTDVTDLVIHLDSERLLHPDLE